MREFTDNSGVIETARYRCTGCGYACLGSELRPVTYERESGERVCNIRRCPQCRGTVAACGESPL